MHDVPATINIQFCCEQHNNQIKIKQNVKRVMFVKDQGEMQKYEFESIFYTKYTDKYTF